MTTGYTRHKLEFAQLEEDGDVRRTERSLRRMTLPASAAERIRLLLVGPTRAYLDSLAAALESSGSMRVTTALPAEARDADTTDVDVILLDYPLPRGILAAYALRRRSGNAKLVAFGVPEREDDLAAWARVGADACISQSASLHELSHLVRAAAHGDAMCSRGVGTVLFRNAALTTRPALADDRVWTSLTRRESEVAELARRGLPNKAIAEALCLELSTVKNHMHRILKKLGAHDRSEIRRAATPQKRDL